MKRLLACAASLMVLTACDPVQLADRLDDVTELENTCFTQPGCSFNLQPLSVLSEPVVIPRRAYVFFPTADTLIFVDSRGRSWTAPERTLTDGASIPPIFTSIVGDPITREFINAAAVHDAYCGIGNEAGPFYQSERWQDVHVMFYDALITGGVEQFTAQLMFAAVWLAGPRWDTLFDNEHVPTAAKQRVMRETKSFIEREKPEFPGLVQYLRNKDRLLKRRYPNPTQDDSPEAEQFVQECTLENCEIYVPPRDTSDTQEPSDDDIVQDDPVVDEEPVVDVSPGTDDGLADEFGDSRDAASSVTPGDLDDFGTGNDA